MHGQVRSGEWRFTDLFLLLVALLFPPVMASGQSSPTQKVTDPAVPEILTAGRWIEGNGVDTSLASAKRDALVTAKENCEAHDWQQCLLDNLSVFTGLDGSKAPEDLGANANFGVRAHVNFGIAIWESVGLGMQIGSGINYSPSAVKVFDNLDLVDQRTQVFTTIGLFQRSPVGFKWGLVYDFLCEDYYAELELGQWRGLVGYQLTEHDEIGVWATTAGHGDRAVVQGFALHLESITQGNLYWRHVWPTGVDTRVWLGLAERHSKFNLVFPGNTPSHDVLTFGSDIFVPLNESLAIFGEAHFITPNDTGTVTATLGVAYYPGGNVFHVARSRFTPLLSVANNPTFAVDVDR